MARPHRRPTTNPKSKASRSSVAKPRPQPSLGPGDMPPCEGPKLHPFPLANASIEWIERIDEERDDYSGSGTPQGYVFKVRIGSQVYATKVFKFFSPEDTRYYWGPVLDKTITPQTVAYHTDPFFAECRAYGRLLEAQERGFLKRQLATPCRGYLYLSEEDSRMLRESGLDFDEECLEPEEMDSNPPRIRAIIKDLASSDAGVDGQAGKILQNIKLMNKLQIYNKDIRIDNFRDGQLIDFGLSWTEPHCYMSKSLDDLAIKNTRTADLFMFDKMIKDEGINTTVKAMRDMNYVRKLRPRK